MAGGVAHAHQGVKGHAVQEFLNRLRRRQLVLRSVQRLRPERGVNLVGGGSFFKAQHGGNLAALRGKQPYGSD